MNTSVIRWMGSKRRIVQSLVAQLPPVGDIDRYFEPFMGSGALFFAYGPSRAVLGDINPDLMNAWAQVQASPVALWRGVSSLPVGKPNYYDVRETFKSERDPFARAVQFVYLNRYCFNGIYRTNRQNHFNVPCGSNTGAMPGLDAFLRCSQALQGVQLRTDDFDSTVQSARTGDVVYLDPPWPTTRPTHGEYGYLDSESSVHRVLEVASGIVERGADLFLSLPENACSDIRVALRAEFSLTYSVASRSHHRLRSNEVLLVAGRRACEVSV